MSIASSTSSVSVSICTGVDTLDELGTGVPIAGVSQSLLVAVSAFSKAAQISLCCSSSSSSVSSSSAPSTVSSATQLRPRRAGEPLVGVRGGVPLGRGGGVGVAGGVPWGKGGGELKQGEPGGSGGWN